MDAIIIQKEADVDQALVSLQGIQNARSTLFSAAAVESTTRPLASTHPGCVGNALDVIQYPDRIRPFLSVVLGQTIIVDTRQTAREVIRNLPEGARAVTLEGEIFL